MTASKPNGKYTTTLRFRNNDNVNRRLKVLKIDSTAFSFEPPKGSNGSSKVAPGMEVAYKITFTPPPIRTTRASSSASRSAKSSWR